MPTVLVVDDDLTFLRTIRRGLHGWTVLIALDGVEGMRVLAEQRAQVDILLLDVVMPNADGLAVVHYVRALAPDLPIVAMSGAPEALTAMSDFGCNAVLAKPASVAEIADQLAAVLRAQGEVERTSAHTTDGELPATDATPVAGADWLDLDDVLISRHITRAVEQHGYQGPTDLLPYLRHTGCVVEQRGMHVPTVAGVLAFAEEPNRWIEHAGVDVFGFQAEETTRPNLVYREVVRGPLTSVIDDTIRLLHAHVTARYSLEGGRRIEQPPYPREVLEELTINALCHRDWSRLGARIRIQVTPAQILWISPGGLPPGVTADNLLRAQTSRNPRIAQLLVHAGYVEQAGMGLDTVFAVLDRAGHGPPVVQDDANFFAIGARRAGLLAEAPQEAAEGNVVMEARRAQIVAMLRELGWQSAPTLAEHLDVSARTIQRDCQALVSQGILIQDGIKRDRRYALAADDAHATNRTKVSDTDTRRVR